MQKPMTMIERWRQGPPTPEERDAFPDRVELVDAARTLRFGKETAHAMAQSGTFPIPLRKIGHSYFANKSDLLRELGLAERQDGAA